MELRKHLFVAMLACCCLTAAAEDETFVFTPQWTAQAQFAGFRVKLLI